MVRSRSAATACLLGIVLALQTPATMAAGPRDRDRPEPGLSPPEPTPNPFPESPVEWYHGERPYWRRGLFRRVASDQVFLFKEWWPSEARAPAFSIPLVAAIVAAQEADGADPQAQRIIQNCRSLIPSRPSRPTLSPALRLPGLEVECRS